MELKDRILGGLIGAAVGDAFGSVTETKTTEAIKQRYGRYVREFRKPPQDVFSRINDLGGVTDDFSLVYLEGKAFIEHDGDISQKLFEDVLIEWSALPMFPFQSGPNSRDQIRRLKGELTTDPKKHYIARSDLYTNGTAMKASPIGMINPGDLDRTIEETIMMCMPTHPATVAISGGCAVSCAVAEAMTENATKASIIDAGLYGAHWGFERSKKVAYPSSGARMERRIQMAVDIAMKYGHDYDKFLYEMASVVGTGFGCAESAAAMFGFFLAARDPMDLILMGVNAGADADSVATIGGALYGVMSGASAFDPRYLGIINKNNYWDPNNTKNYDVEKIAEGMAAIAERRMQK